MTNPQIRVISKLSMSWAQRTSGEKVDTKLHRVSKSCEIEATKMWRKDLKAIEPLELLDGLSIYGSGSGAIKGRQVDV